MIEIEKLLVPEEMIFPQGDSIIIVDFISKIRSFPNLCSFGTFGNAIKCVLSAGQSMSCRTSFHVVFDSYIESSVKSGERTRRSVGTSSVDMTLIGPDVPIPKQMNKFWPSPSNKTNSQLLTRMLAREQHSSHPIILTGCLVDNEVMPAEFID